jgi:hypothetical protein
MKARMSLIVFILLAVRVAASPALAQSAADGAAQKAPEQHQPGVAAKPAQPSQGVAPAKAPAQAPAAKLDPGKDAAIRHLMDITEVSKLGENIQSYITHQVQEVAGRAVAPDKVQKFMDTFSTKFNTTASPAAVTDAMVTIYAKNFSMEDVQGLIQFYETPLGQRVVKSMPEISQQSQRVGVEMDQDAALVVLRGMSTEYPEIKPMLPAEEGKPTESAPAPSAAPAPSPAPAPRTAPAPKPATAPGTPAAPKPAPQN